MIAVAPGTVCSAWNTSAPVKPLAVGSAEAAAGAGAGAAKKKVVETFNQKEKRKRDLGQASRGKNFVEGACTAHSVYRV